MDSSSFSQPSKKRDKDYIYLYICKNLSYLPKLINMSTFNVAQARARFPALQQPQIYLDNAGTIISCSHHFIKSFFILF